MTMSLSIRCLAAGWSFEGSNVTLPLHLSKEHYVRTIAHYNIAPAWLTMEPFDEFVLVKVDQAENGGKTYPLYLVYLEIQETLGSFKYTKSSSQSCESGHTACSACCKNLASKKCPTCTLPLTGSNRCVAVETILKSLEVSCKYSRYGCRHMTFISYSIGSHETYCMYKPMPCPVPECTFKGSSDTLPEHLTGEHHVRTVAYNEISAAGFTMESSDHMVMVNVNNTIGGGRDVHLVHREVHDAVGEVFFCTTFKNDHYHDLVYNLKVQQKSVHRQPTLSLKSAPIQHLRFMEEYWKDFLLLPMKNMRRAEQVQVHFRVIRRCLHDDN